MTVGSAKTIGPPEGFRAQPIDSALEFAASYLLSALMLVLPWGVYQRVPLLDLTMTKALGAALVGVAFLRAFRHATWTLPKTGLEAPGLLFATACAFSVVWSRDRAASLDILVIYGTYLAIFCAIVWTVREPKTARRLFMLFVFSSAALGALTIACYLGFAKPTWWYTAFWPQQPLIEEWRSGLPMRMVAAGTDLNEGALPLLLAVAIALHVGVPRRLYTVQSVLFGVLVTILAAGIAIAMSRSTLVILAALAVAFAFRRLGPPRALLVTLLVFVAGATAVYLLDTTSANVLWERAQGGISRDDGSARNRVIVYRDAIAIAPMYAVVGAGLGASDVVLRQHSTAADLYGITLHSMPLKFALELGWIGLAAYLWLWWRIVRIALAHIARSVDEEFAETGRALRDIALVLFVVLLIQPFQILSLIPILLAVGLGQAIRRSSREPTLNIQSPSNVVPVCLATSTVTVLIIWNFAQYQQTFAEVSAYGDRLALAIESERSMEWRTANERYSDAVQISAPGWGKSDAEHGGKRLAEAAFFPVAARTYDLPRLYKEAMLGVPSPTPEAAACIGIQRTLLVLGKPDEAAMQAEFLVEQDDRFVGALFDIAEALWARREFARALTLYERARAAENQQGSFGDRARRLNERCQWLAREGESEVETAEYAALLRRQGRWEDSLVTYRRLLERWPDNSHALFKIGVGHEIAGNNLKAEQYYDRARDH